MKLFMLHQVKPSNCIITHNFASHILLSFFGLVILSDPNLRDRVKNDLAQLVYDCFYLAKVPNDISPARHMYLPLDEIDWRSFDGVGKVIFL